MLFRSKPRVVMSAPDWDLVEKVPNRFRTMAPKRDIVATDGQKVTLGDGSVTLITTPGHTPGTLSMIFQVKDNGKPLTVVYSGGTAFNFVNDVPHFDTYIASQKKFADLAAHGGQRRPVADPGARVGPPAQRGQPAERRGGESAGIVDRGGEFAQRGGEGVVAEGHGGGCFNHGFHGLLGWVWNMKSRRQVRIGCGSPVNSRGAFFQPP